MAQFDGMKDDGFPPKLANTKPSGHLDVKYTV